MSRRTWSEEELLLLKDGASWEDFNTAFPGRTYDSWEVKRRRVGGSAGQSRAYGLRKADELAESILMVLEKYLEKRRA